MQWIKRIFSKDEAKPQGTPSAKNVVLTSGREVPSSLSHLLKGYRLCVTMSMNTPLKRLERDGEIAEKPSDVPPHLAIWLPELKSAEDLGLNLPDLTPQTRASQFGYIPHDGGDALNFLKKYRMIIESEAAEGEKREQLDRLENAYGDLVAKVTHDLAAYYFQGQLQRDLNCGPVTAQRLYDAGLTTPAKVKSAPLKTLCSINGIGQKTALKLQGTQRPL